MKYGAVKKATVQSMGVRNQTSCIICMVVTLHMSVVHHPAKKYMIFSAVFCKSARYYVYLGVAHGVYTKSKDTRPRKI